MVHTINQQIKCTPCKLVFQTELDLEWHIETEHEPSIKVLLSTSEACGNKLANNDLNNHISEMHDELNQETCRKCDFKLTV